MTVTTRHANPKVKGGDAELPPEIPSAPARKEPCDPARAAAQALLIQAISSANTNAEAAGRDGCICTILVPDPTWTSLVAAAWSAEVRGGSRYSDAHQHSHYSDAEWLVWYPTSAPDTHAATRAAKLFSKAVSQGIHCLGIAADITWLPKDLVQAADFRLEMPLLSPKSLASVVTILCSEKPSKVPSADIASRLTPRLLRLGCRVGQTADAYVQKLAELLALDEAVVLPVAPPTTIRAAPTLERLYGMDEAKAWGMRLAQDIATYRRGELDWSAIDRGCLVSGPTGCGKTLFARATAASCGVPLVSTSYGAWHGSGGAHQGDLLKAMRKTFSDAHDNTPCIVFLDEIDSFPNRGTLTHHYAGWDIQVVNALLAEIDGAEARQGVVVIGACNFPDKLDPALVRSGRLDRHIRISLPNREALLAILREHLGSDLASADLSPVVLAATGSSGADCERFVRGARRRARSNSREMQIMDLLAELGGERLSSPDDRRRAAIHEAGHAAAIRHLRPETLLMVSIQGDSESGGSIILGSNGSNYVVAEDVQANLIITLAGRAAEEDIFGSPSSGAGGDPGCDLSRATEIAVRAEMSYGLGQSGNLVWGGMPTAHEVTDMLRKDLRLARRISGVLMAAYSDACKLVGHHKGAILALAASLASRNTINGPDAIAILDGSTDDTGLVQRRR